MPEENYWFRRHLAVYEWIAARAHGRRVVDLACGEGYGSAVLVVLASAIPVYLAHRLTVDREGDSAAAAPAGAVAAAH